MALANPEKNAVVDNRWFVYLSDWDVKLQERANGPLSVGEMVS